MVLSILSMNAVNYINKVNEKYPSFRHFWLKAESCSLYWAVWINSVAISSIQGACEVSLERMKEPLDSDGDIIKDGCQLAH